MNPSPRARRWLRVPFTCAFAAALMACGDGQSSGAQPAGESLESAVARLEASGQLPVLDRTDSLAGIDANANGVRDDIERHIERKYMEPAQRRAAMREALIFQQMLMANTSEPSALQALIDKSALSSRCAFEAFGGSQGIAQREEMSRELESMTTNTKQRLLAYLGFNRAVSGFVSPEAKGGDCD